MGVGQSSEVSSLAGYASVQVAVEKSMYGAGETVRGYAQLEVKQPTNMYSVTVQLVGEAKTAVLYTVYHEEGSSSHTARETAPVVALEARVANFPSGTAPAGTWQCPFEFVLPLDAPSSMARQGKGSNTASLAYYAAVVVSRPKWASSKLVHRVMIDVVAAPPALVAPPRRDEAVKVTRCCCIPAGDMTLGAAASKNAYVGGERPEVLYAVDNASTQVVGRVSVTLYQNIRFNAGTHGHSFRSVVAGVDAPPVAMGDRFGFDGGAPARSAEIQLPPTFSAFSLHTRTIEVTHQIVVKCKTESEFVKDPHIVLDTWLYRTTPLPYAVPLDEGEGQQGIPAVAVPIAYAPDASLALPGAPACPTAVPIDTTGDGVADSWGWDTSGDGRVDKVQART